MCDETVLIYKRDQLDPYAGLPFKFRVLALNYIGYSEPSGSVRILTAEVPGMPSSPERVASDRTFITIRWQAPSYTGGVQIEAYDVYVKPEGGSFVSQLTLTDLSDLVFT